VRPPFTFGRILQPGLEFSLRTHAGPRAPAIGDEGIGLSGKLVSAQHAVILPDLSHPAHGHHLSVHVQIVTCQVPPCCDSHAGNRNEVIADREVAC
jgi:hypothetical protein